MAQPYRHPSGLELKGPQRVGPQILLSCWEDPGGSRPAILTSPLSLGRPDSGSTVEAALLDPIPATLPPWRPCLGKDLYLCFRGLRRRSLLLW